MVTENLPLGILLILVAGVFQGSFMLPMKYTPGWNWENAWLGFSATAYLILPWLIADLTVPHVKEVLTQTSMATMSRTFLFGLGWGFGALMFGLGVDYLGMALGFAIILGLTASIGTLVPLLVLSSEKLMSRQGALIVTGVVVMLLGISLCSWAGRLKENALSGRGASVMRTQTRSYAIGLLFCLLSGVLSPCGNLGFAFGSEISAMAIKYGTSEQFAAAPLWAVITLPLFVCNVGFCLYLLVRNGSLAKFVSPQTHHYYVLTAAMGALWIGGMTLYGAGAHKLGRLGPSMGWAILMSSIVMVANLWGVLTGEWRGSGREPARIMGLGLIFLLTAIFIIGVSNKP